MYEFKIECYIARDEKETIKLSDIDKKDLAAWQKEIEVRALSEYYNRKIEILDDKKAFD